MPGSDDLAARLMQIEERSAFQDAEINTLSLRIIEQQQQIDALLLAQERMRAQFQALEQKDASDVPVHERPPHY
jgi:uncharacterized coiled-coil protein SlyX